MQETAVYRKEKKEKESRRRTATKRCPVQASRHHELKKVVCILRRWPAVAGKSPLKRSGRRIRLSFSLRSSPFPSLPDFSSSPSLVSSGYLPGYERAHRKARLLKSMPENIPSR